MKKVKKVIIACAVFGACAAAFNVSGCASCSRTLKSFSSDFGGGLDRTVTLYDYNGNVLDSWSGKFDLSSSEKEIYFDDENDKRVIIHGGIVVAEEN